MQNIWTTYKSIIYKNCTVAGIERNSVDYWKNQLFAATVMLVIPMSMIALIPGIYLGYNFWLVGMLISDLVTIVVVSAVAFMPGLSIFLRKLLFNGVLYSSSFVLLHYLGTNGPGMLYLFGITIFVVLSLPPRYGYIALGLNTLICIYFAIAIHYGFASHVILSEYEVNTWIGVSSNLVFLSGVAVLLIPKLFNGLQSAFDGQNRLQDQLKQSVDDLNTKNKELEQFAYTVSHDLKEPLRMVRSFMKLLKNKYGKKLDEKAHEYIHYAIDGAERMSANIDDLLEYSRIGRKYTTVEQTNLNELLDEVIQNLTSIIEVRDAQISVEELPTLPVVPVAIKMLFQNLISNAIKYQPEGQKPMVNIAAKEHEDHWQFSVADNGIGIDPEYHGQIFRVFKRLHTHEEYSGNGMGLAICKKIVEQHGGKIQVVSQTDMGSKFKFTIVKQYFTENLTERDKSY